MPESDAGSVGVAASVSDIIFFFLTCTQMLIHAIALGGCTDTVSESALEVDSEID